MGWLLEPRSQFLLAIFSLRLWELTVERAGTDRVGGWAKIRLITNIRPMLSAAMLQAAQFGHSARKSVPATLTQDVS